uniref:SUS3 n=1 Tax=Arundo donax TaxID=35708 RepID=A0A0A9FT21_ARUDO
MEVCFQAYLHWSLIFADAHISKSKQQFQRTFCEQTGLRTVRTSSQNFSV